jgi:hypothetical protein
MLLMAAAALPLTCLSQASHDNHEMLDRIADDLLATVEADQSYDELYETLTHLLASPVNLNRVTSEQLRAIMILKEKEISAFLQYRNTCGELLNVLELQAVPGWTQETVNRVLPFVYVPDPTARVEGRWKKGLPTPPRIHLVVTPATRTDTTSDIAW